MRKIISGRATPPKRKVKQSHKIQMMQTLLELVVSAGRGLPDGAITPEHTFYDLGYDSLDTIELAMAVEEEFHIVIPDEKLMVWKCTQDLYDFIIEQLETTPMDAAQADVVIASLFDTQGRLYKGDQDGVRDFCEAVFDPEGRVSDALDSAVRRRMRDYMPLAYTDLARLFYACEAQRVYNAAAQKLMFA